MIECIFTLDYEIYGNGQGSLRELVHDPAQKLIATFRRWNLPMVNFVEVAELERIEERGTDPAIDDVRRQLRTMYEQDHEIALHLHPQWTNAEFREGQWRVDYSEYNLCTLPRERIAQIVDDGIAYLRGVLGDRKFTALSFRAGNWLLQPSERVAGVLAERGIRVDSSVFKGGMQQERGLDYRAAINNGYYWKFRRDVTVSDPEGILLEVPIYTRQVPFWRLITRKRLALQRRSRSAAQVVSQNCSTFRNRLRLKYPVKFDYCRMTLHELIDMMERAIEQDQKTPEAYKPLVAIGHTKDLKDISTVESLLEYLSSRQIRVSTLSKVYEKCCRCTRSSG
jgi:hypothetical protein